MADPSEVGVAGATERPISFKIIYPKTPQFHMFEAFVELVQAEASHDMLSITYKGALQRHVPKRGTRRIPIKNDPVKFTWTDGKRSRTFVGYIHTIENNTTAGNVFTKIVCISVSSKLKATNKGVYKNLTADKIVNKIAKKFKFKVTASPSIKKYTSLSQSGKTYWQILRQLANDTGFALRAENATITFEDKDKIIEKKKGTAPTFVHYDMAPMGMAHKQTLMSFTSLVSRNSPETSQSDSSVSIDVPEGDDSGFIVQDFATDTFMTDSYSDETKDIVLVPNDWQETYTVVEETTVDGFSDA
ncbi:hypothetical protein UFOVP621_24 [uncultured Caudovirales phage]|uniref:Uncharacterized protein n=1 Tax=uncultured Caudovirales phage TaxID=2100421 RepID=A0A6J5N214_9CAUD|nr:hypothetical protein UFOVP621_24 [uncultured Caudovirales phage]